jgi:adenosylmethionine-8-amino-7-oxononanoate aminotransferase
MSVIRRDRMTVWHPYSSVHNSLPLWEVESASGVRLQLCGEDGQHHEVIDAMSSWWCMIHGYQNPTLDAAAVRQLGQFSHVMFGGLTHAPAVTLAERLIAKTPSGLDHVFFADSGSVSVEVALKLAIQFQTAQGFRNRQRILSIRGGYHGDTFGAMGVCDPVDGMHSAFSGRLSSNIFAPRPPEASTARAEDIERWAAEVADIAATNSNDVAAIIVEPVLQGAGGMFVYPPECLVHLRHIADNNGLLLIFDEIATGFGRTGEFFAANHVNISPDIMCVGKALTGGYLTLAAMLCTRDVARIVSSGPSGALLHGPTFMANPLACAVANASLGLLESEPWQTHVERIRVEMATGLKPAMKLACVRDVRTVGAVGVIQLHGPVDVAAITRSAVRHGVWVRPFRDLVYAIPPYISTSSDIETITAGMVTAVVEVHGTDSEDTLR